MPDDKTLEKETKVEIKATKKTEPVAFKADEFAEPYLKKQILAPNSPWKILQGDESIITYTLEIVGIGVLIRTESPAMQSESMVFIPNIKSSDLPVCK